jgi:hypothetical protein
MSDDEPQTESEHTEPPWRGVWVVGGDLQISDLSFSINEDGTFTAAPPTVRVRTDMWPFWLEDAVEASDTACREADRIMALVPELDAAADDEARQAVSDRINVLLSRELRACMRTLTACAFAFDALYATVKERCGPHPHDATWAENGTARHKRITETLRHHLKLNEPNIMKQLKYGVSQMFKYRDWAVHMAANYREPAPRVDLGASLDWHFNAFRRENAVTAVAFSVSSLDYLVSIMHRGGVELANSQGIARQRMDDVYRAYQQVDALPSIVRSSRSTQSPDALTSDGTERSG